MKLECRELEFAIAEVTVMIAVGEPRCEFSQVALSDRLTAHGTERSRLGRPAIHQDEFHCPSPNERRSRRSLTIEIARLFGIATSNIVMEGSAAQTLEQSRTGRFESCFGLGHTQFSRRSAKCAVSNSGPTSSLSGLRPGSCNFFGNALAEMPTKSQMRINRSRSRNDTR
jgi:hypothetical protein